MGLSIPSHPFPSSRGDDTIHDPGGPVNAVSMGFADHQSDDSVKPARGCKN
jgi:hypothetical protein